jgi:hypothetical protein
MTKKQITIAALAVGVALAGALVWNTYTEVGTVDTSGADSVRDALNAIPD